ncbi:MAG: hypothetical protein CMP10_18280 [Zetaproteobacteria bacterium]|nr:hypothetical protein [Pseudobdellovibrionaceae bacterium]
MYNQDPVAPAAPAITVSASKDRFYQDPFYVEVDIQSQTPLAEVAYELNGTRYQSNKSNFLINIAAETSVGETSKLKVIATNDQGTATSDVYQWKRIPPGPGINIYFEKPGPWQMPWVWFDRDSDGSFETRVPGKPPGDMEEYRTRENRVWYKKFIPDVYEVTFHFNDGNINTTVKSEGRDFQTNKDIWVRANGMGSYKDPFSPKAPAVEVEPRGRAFTSRSIEVKLSIKGEYDEAKYTTDGSDPRQGRSFDNGTTVRLGDNLQAGEKLLLQVYARNAIGEFVTSETFERISARKRDNITILQGFYWYIPNPLTMVEDYVREREPESDLWDYYARDGAKKVYEDGFTHIWLPPMGKAFRDIPERADQGNYFNVGYAIYDHYDLGEFSQMRSVRTKYGTKNKLQQAISAFHDYDIKVIADIVLNHMLGSDQPEQIEFSNAFDKGGNNLGNGRRLAYLKFDFNAAEDENPRGTTYSDFVWNRDHFDGMEYNGLFYLFKGKTLDRVNNFGDTSGSRLYQYMRSDIILGADIDLQNPEVQQELIRWTKWLVETTDIDGFRVDAVRHMDTPFVVRWAREIREYMKERGKDPSQMLMFGENWDGWAQRLAAYLNGRAKGSSTDYILNPNDYTGIEKSMSLFDVPLHYDFRKIAGANAEIMDISTLPGRGLVGVAGNDAVTFVDNHDTVPTQELRSYIPLHTKLQAYTYILLHEFGRPCVYYRDMYKGNFVSDYENNNKEYLYRNIKDLIAARQNYAYGRGEYYTQVKGLLGQRRYGDADHPGGLVYLIRQYNSQNSRMTISNIPANFKLVAGQGKREGDQFILDSNVPFAVWAPPL